MSQFVVTWGDGEVGNFSNVTDAVKKMSECISEEGKLEEDMQIFMNGMLLDAATILSMLKSESYKECVR